MMVIVPMHNLELAAVHLLAKGAINVNEFLVILHRTHYQLLKE